MTEFRYRYVGFGTNFERSTVDLRPVDYEELAPQEREDTEEGKRKKKEFAEKFAANRLCQNELALDVGGMCGGFDENDLSVIDHHFPREPFPSASAAVLHKARLIREKFNAAKCFPVIWLVTHSQPDFDAFCSMYLARSIIEASNIGALVRLELGEQSWHEDSEADRRKVNWYDPHLPDFPADLRWMILSASYAVRVDHGRRIECPKHRALHSILYAALTRGRDYENRDSGAKEFFDEVKAAITKDALNPLTDSVLAGSSTFRPELEFLEEDLKRYVRDIGRARKVVVHLQWHEPGLFQKLFDQLANIPLLVRTPGSGTVIQIGAEHLKIAAEHLLENGERRQTDGIYIRDPECLLFKEWARMDIENSPMGEGFLFTAVAYSSGCPAGEINRTQYYFSLDPERANGRHLYTLWAKLQEREIAAICNDPELRVCKDSQLRDRLERSDDGGPKVARRSFEHRAGDFSALFNDPWFDGSNYNCTIVVTPNRGTYIAGPLADLERDEVIGIVRHELEDTIYVSQPPKVTLLDLSAGEPGENGDDYEFNKVPELPARHFRFGRIALRQEHLDLHSGNLAKQIGTDLWHILHPKAQEGLTPELIARHVFTTRDWMGVWSRTGVIIAYKPGDGEKDADNAEDLFRKIVDLARSVQQQFEDETDKSDKEKHGKDEGGSDKSKDKRRSKESMDKKHKAEARLTRTAGEKHGKDEGGSDKSKDKRRNKENMDKKLEARLTRTAGDLRYRLILPENRLLSQFYDAINIGEALQSVRDMLLGANIDTTAEVQTKVEWLEIFLVGFYGTELASSVVEHLPFLNPKSLTTPELSLSAFDQARKVTIIVGAGAIFTLVTYLLLRPWRHKRSQTLFVLLLLAGFAYLLALGAAWRWETSSVGLGFGLGLTAVWIIVIVLPQYVVVREVLRSL